MIEYQLRNGTRPTGLVLRPDAKVPQLWRIHYRGQISDMVNLTRAKDAAVSWVRTKDGPPLSANWDRIETATHARTSI